MTKFFSIVSICICAFVTVQTAAVSPQDCEHTFQSQLKELLATRQKCGSGSINDCCQVNYVSHLLYRADSYTCMLPV